MDASSRKGSGTLVAKVLLSCPIEVSLVPPLVLT